MFFPSGEKAQEVILVRVPRSLDLTTMTVFCFRLFSTSQMLRDERDRKQSDLSTGCPGRERKKRKRGKDGDGPDGAVV
jgi:hypothetical protein